MLLFYISSNAFQAPWQQKRHAYKMFNMKRRRELTTEERQEAERLSSAWETFKAENRGSSQAWLAAESGLGTQGAVHQYLRGIIPLNLTALLAICRVIGTEPKQISPRLAAMIGDVQLQQAEGKVDGSSLTVARTAREQLLLMAYRAGGEAERTAMDVLAEQVLKRVSSSSTR